MRKLPGQHSAGVDERMGWDDGRTHLEEHALLSEFHSSLKVKQVIEVSREYQRRILVCTDSCVLVKRE